jgi:hypothetical protein
MMELGLIAQARNDVVAETPDEAEIPPAKKPRISKDEAVQFTSHTNGVVVKKLQDEAATNGWWIELHAGSVYYCCKCVLLRRAAGLVLFLLHDFRTVCAVVSGKNCVFRQ